MLKHIKLGHDTIHVVEHFLHFAATWGALIECAREGWEFVAHHLMGAVL